MADAPIIYLPPSRFVSGSLTDKNTTDSNGRPIEEKKQQFRIGVAIRKDSPDFNEFWAKLLGAAKQVYAHNPQIAPLIDAWTQNGFQGFSMKFKDGDQPAIRTGNVNPNTAGCWVLYLSSSYAFNCYDDQNIQIDPSTISRGFFIEGTLSIGANNLPIGDHVGIYMNPGMIKFIGVGEVITGGLNVDEHMKHMAAASQLPPGALPPGSAPVTPGAAAIPGMAPVQQQQQYAPGPAPVQQQQQYAPGPAPVQQQQYAPSPNGPPVTPAAGMPPGVPVGTPQAAPVAPPAGIASPGSAQQPPYPGIMNPPGS